MLTHTAKNLCKLIESDGTHEEYGRRRRYAGTDDEWMRDRLRKMEDEAPSEYVKREVHQYVDRMK